MAKRPRLFWMGMHKVLKPTELKRLRDLGYEVFNPAYLSPIYDQSADPTIDLDQPTTLPPEVFAKLISHNFFYNPIDEEIGELLNEYFDVAIVTISFLWLKDLAKAFRGRIIYRIYGQHWLQSERFIETGLWDMLHDRPGFTIVPFAAETVVNEHRWFVDMIGAIVPYQIPDEVFEHGGTWQPGPRERIATIFPNVAHPYYGEAYEAFRSRFPESFFQIYGPQRSHPADPRFVGRLDRSVQLDRLQRSAGFYYDYRDGVCYLPPIESMQLGVPVVCARGSLLADFLGRGSPNVALDDEDARAKLVRLVHGDQVLAEELIAAQDGVRSRYDRAVVLPAFDAAFTRLIEAPAEPAAAAVPAITTAARRSKIVVPLHVDGLFRHRNGRVYAFEGIPRVADSIVRLLAATSHVGFLVTCTLASREILYDFFLEEIKAGVVELIVVGNGSTDTVQIALDRVALVERLNADDSVSSVLVPHYYIFPELIGVQRRSVLYLPDYFPHLSPDEVFDLSAERDRINKEVGIAHAHKADIILTNSNFTKRYLPDTGFVSREDVGKVLVAPLPFLGAGRARDLVDEEVRLLEDQLGDRPFILYPTANRPNKRMDFLMEVYAELLRRQPDLALVMTGSLHTYQPALRKAQKLGLVDHIVFIHQASEGVLRWLYEHCRAMCLTSVLEGNFPPQVLEAIGYRAPVVATRLPMITEILGDRADELLLCRALDLDDFLAKLDIAFTQREAVLARQDAIGTYLQTWNSREAFIARLHVAFPEAAGAGAAA